MPGPLCHSETPNVSISPTTYTQALRLVSLALNRRYDRVVQASRVSQSGRNGGGCDHNLLKTKANVPPKNVMASRKPRYVFCWSDRSRSISYVCIGGSPYGY